MDDDDATEDHARIFASRGDDVLATVELPARLLLTSPDAVDPRSVFDARPGRYQITEHGENCRVGLIAHVEAEVATWRPLGCSSDDMYIVAPVGTDVEHIHGVPTTNWYYAEAFIWLQNLDGNFVYPYVGLAADDTVVAVLVEFR